VSHPFERQGTRSKNAVKRERTIIAGHTGTEMPPFVGLGSLSTSSPVPINRQSQARYYGDIEKSHTATRSGWFDDPFERFPFRFSLPLLAPNSLPPVFEMYLRPSIAPAHRLLEVGSFLRVLLVLLASILRSDCYGIFVFSCHLLASYPWLDSSKSWYRGSIGRISAISWLNAAD
jgi:hypothetical protein